MVLAKPLSSKPRDVAAKLADALGSRLGSLCEAPEIAGPGFINLRLKNEFVAGKVKTMVEDGQRLGIPRYVVVSGALCVFRNILPSRWAPLKSVGNLPSPGGALYVFWKTRAPSWGELVV